MSINNVISNISLSNQLQLSSGQLDTRLASDAGLDASASGLIVSPSYQQLKHSLHVTSSQFKNLVGTRVQVIAAPAAGQIITVDNMENFCDYGTAQYTVGGNLILQYGDVSYDANLAATAPIANTVFNAVAADAMVRVAGTMTNLLAPPYATGVYMAVQVNDFQTGDGDFYVTVWYKVYAP